MTMLVPLAAYLLAALSSNAPDLSATCANNPKLLNPRTLSEQEVRVLVHFYENGETRVTGLADYSIEMTGPCIARLRTVASGISFDNGRAVIPSAPPLELIRDWQDTVYPYKFRAAPMNPELMAIDGANVGSKRKLHYVTSLYETAHRRIGLWTNGKVSAVETLVCTQDDKCADPMPLISSTHPIRQISYMGNPDSHPSGELNLWVHGGAGREYWIRLGLKLAPPTR